MSVHGLIATSDLSDPLSAPEWLPDKDRPELRSNVSRRQADSPHLPET